MKVKAGLLPPGGFEGDSFLNLFPGFWGLPVHFGLLVLWLSHSSLRPHFYIVSSPCILSFPLLFQGQLSLDLGLALFQDYLILRSLP